MQKKMIEIQKVKSVTFTVQAELLNLLHHAFAYMEGRIDPPSSLHRLNGEALQRKIAEEDLFIAVDGGRLIGCVFAKINIDHIYLGKLAVHQDYRGKGLCRQLIAEVEQLTRQCKLPGVELETRVELTENHRLFEYLGFVKVAENSHEGYYQPTSYRYLKKVA